VPTKTFDEVGSITAENSPRRSCINQAAIAFQAASIAAAFVDRKLSQGLLLVAALARFGSHVCVLCLCVDSCVLHFFKHIVKSNSSSTSDAMWIKTRNV